MEYGSSYCHKNRLDTSELNEAQRTLHFIAENMKMEERISVDGYEDFQKAISALSENKGEWILVVDSYYEDGTIKENHWECSRCGSGRSGWGEFKFCPDCGADMRGKANE